MFNKFLFLALIFTYSMAFSQWTNVMIDNSGGPNETCIAINPKNTNYLIAGANINFYYYSSNSGTTWSKGTMSSSLYGVWGDMCMIWDTNNVCYAFHLSNSSSPGYWIDRIVCQKSTNYGANYINPGTYTFFLSHKEQDKEWAVVDPRNNYIYVTWTQFDNYGTSNQLDSSNILFSKSTDGGNTWVTFSNGQTAKRINLTGGDCVDSDNTVEGAVPAVGPNGEIYVAWSGPKVRNSQFGLFFNKSTDAGNTWLSTPTYIGNQPGGWDYGVSGIYRANGLPITLCDLSNGPYRGRIYVNYTDSAGANDHDVKVLWSTNGGTNWSAPVRVNNDPAGKEQFFTWMTIDQKTGYLYCVFYDRRNYTGNYTQVYLARSTNGGVNWTNDSIATSPFLPNATTFFGDYNGITAHNGKVRPIWTRLVGSALSIWTAIIDFPTPVENNNGKIPVKFSLEQNYPNPFNPVTKIKFTVKQEAKHKTQDIKIVVYNILGKQIKTLVNETMNPGTYEIEFNGSELSSGTYFYKLTAGNYTDVRKMTLVK
jgi:hypothetical protein